MTQRIPKLPRQQPQGIFQGRDGYRLPSLHDYAAMVRIILNCSCLPPQGKAAVFFKTGFDLPAAVCYHQNAISGYDGIGRHARFRFSCRETCRFDPCYRTTSSQAVYRLRRFFMLCIKTPCAHSAAPPFQIEPASLGFDLVPVKSKHRSVSASRRKLHYVSSFFYTNSFLWETGSGLFVLSSKRTTETRRGSPRP